MFGIVRLICNPPDENNPNQREKPGKKVFDVPASEAETLRRRLVGMGYSVTVQQL